MIYGDVSAEGQITVQMDPRLDVSQQAIDNAYDNGKTLEGMTQTAADAVKQLVESKNIAEEYKKVLGKLDKEANKDAIDQSKEIIKEINDYILAFGTSYSNLMFVVYDLGHIRDVDLFSREFERHENVIVRVVKH